MRLRFAAILTSTLLAGPALAEEAGPLPTLDAYIAGIVEKDVQIDGLLAYGGVMEENFTFYDEAGNPFRAIMDSGRKDRTTAEEGCKINGFMREKSKMCKIRAKATTLIDSGSLILSIYEVEELKLPN